MKRNQKYVVIILYDNLILIQMKHTNYKYDEVIILRINADDKAQLKRDAFKKGRKLSQHLREELLK